MMEISLHTHPCYPIDTSVSRGYAGIFLRTPVLRQRAAGAGTSQPLLGKEEFPRNPTALTTMCSRTSGRPLQFTRPQYSSILVSAIAYHSSIITAGNGGTQPTQAALTIFYNQGTQKYELVQTLQPDEQMWIDIGKLIREHVADKNGNTLPPTATSGSFEIRDLTHT